MTAKRVIIPIAICLSLLLMGKAWIRIARNEIESLDFPFAEIDEIFEAVTGDEITEAIIDDLINSIGIGEYTVQELFENYSVVRGCISDHMVSPFELLKVSVIVLRERNHFIVAFLGFQKWVNNSLLFSGSDLSLSGDEIEETEHSWKIFVILGAVYFVLFTFSLLFGVLSLICSLFKKGRFAYIAYYFFSSILFLFFVFGILLLNNSVGEKVLHIKLTGLFSVALAFLAFELQIRWPQVSSVGKGANLLSGKFPQLSVVSIVLDKIKNSIGGDNIGNYIKGGFWICNNCGKMNSRSFLFCSNCGTKKPEKPRCGQCGKELENGFSYCVFCGAQIENKTPAPETTRIIKYCKFCGGTIPISSDFCPECGENLLGEDDAE